MPAQNFCFDFPLQQKQSTRHHLQIIVFFAYFSVYYFLQYRNEIPRTQVYV